MDGGLSADSVRRMLVRTDVYYGWFVVGACFLCAMVCFGTIYSFGVFFEFIQAEFEGSYAGTSLIFSMQSIVTFGGGALLGFFIDQYGSRPLLLAGAALFAVGLIAVSQVQSFIAITFAYGIVAAMGMSVFYVIGYATTPRWFERRLGLATAVATAGAGVGILIMPRIAAELIGVLGWRDAYLALMVGFLAMILLAVLVVADHPDVVGAHAGKEFAGGRPSVVDAAMRTQIAQVATLLRTPSFLLVFAGYVMIFFPAYMLLVHVVEYANTTGIGREVGVLAIGVIGAMNITGKFVFGGVNDRFGTPTAVMGCGIAAGGGTLLLTAVPSHHTLLVGVLVFGLGYGGSVALLSPMLADLFGTANINALLGVTSVAFAITGSLAPPIAGLSFDLVGSFAPGFFGGALLALLAGPVLVLADRMKPAAG